MFIIIGAIVVLASLIVGFSMAGGHLAVLFQPSEFITIGGAAIGSLFISASLDEIKNEENQLLLDNGENIFKKIKSKINTILLKNLPLLPILLVNPII